MHDEPDDGYGGRARFEHERLTTAPEASLRDDIKTSYDGAWHTYASAMTQVRLIRRELLRLSSEGIVLCKLLNEPHQAQLHLDAVAQLDAIENRLQQQALIRPNEFIR